MVVCASLTLHWGSVIVQQSLPDEGFQRNGIHVWKNSYNNLNLVGSVVDEDVLLGLVPYGSDGCLQWSFAMRDWCWFG
jgi:hypothetical protein